MVDYQDPVTIAQELTALVKVWHITNGIFIWEFFTTLYYEWDIIRGTRNRPLPWTIWVYLTVRAAAILAVILNMVGFDAATPINCQLWVTFEVFFANLAMVGSALLIVLRIIAIWNTEKIIVVIAMGIWVADVALHINGIIRIRSAWSPESNMCLLTNLEVTKPNIIASLVSDVVLLLIMLTGIFRLRLEAGNDFGLGHILWNQGFVWLLLATIAGVPSTVFINLNLNVSLDLMFQTPCLVATTIAVTRMYRSLIDIRSNRSTPPGSRATLSEMRVRSGPIQLDQLDVSAHTERDQCPASQSGYDLYITTGPEEPYKAHQVSLDVDVENGPEK